MADEIIAPLPEVPREGKATEQDVAPFNTVIVRSPKTGEGIGAYQMSDDIREIQEQSLPSRDRYYSALLAFIREKERQVLQLTEQLSGSRSDVGRLNEKLRVAQSRSARLAKKNGVLRERLDGIAGQRGWRAFAGGVGLALVGLAGNLFTNDKLQILAWLLLIIGMALFAGSVWFRVTRDGKDDNA